MKCKFDIRGYQLLVWKTPYRGLRAGWCREEIASRGIRTAAEKRHNGIPDEVHPVLRGLPANQPQPSIPIPLYLPYSLILCISYFTLI